MTDTLRETLANLPHTPGVYQYFNVNGDLLYIGKAKNLSKRVKSYFQKSNHLPWTELMVEEIASIRTIEVKTELEALMLENSLIKSLRPKYNIQLKDDKTFPFIRISQDNFPRFTVVRKVKNDGAKYLGPYLSATYLRSLLQLVQGLYGIKVASDQSYESRSTVPNQIGLGARNLDNIDTYNSHVHQAIKFIDSPQPHMERTIRQAMAQAAADQEYERAAILRDRLQALEILRQKQSLFSPSVVNRDYLGIAITGHLASVFILRERGTSMIDHKKFMFDIPEAIAPAELLTEVISYLYINGLPVPHEIVVSHEPLDSKTFAQALREQTGTKVKFVVPQRGDSKKRLDTTNDNAAYQLKLEALKKTRRETALADLAKILQLKAIPKRIEAFDISNLGPTNIVGASIVFINGQPAKNEYRKYKIFTTEGQDDFASMRELVFRRLKNSDRPVPDLLLIDGGKGQLSAAIDALDFLKHQVPLVALAKKEELLYVPNQTEPIVLPHSSEALLLLMALRDEVHRFVLSFHRQRRSKQTFSK